jgi:hypothetical protein
MNQDLPSPMVSYYMEASRIPIPFLNYPFPCSLSELGFLYPPYLIQLFLHLFHSLPFLSTQIHSLSFDI